MVRYAVAWRWSRGILFGQILSPLEIQTWLSVCAVAVKCIHLCPLALAPHRQQIDFYSKISNWVLGSSSEVFVCRSAFRKLKVVHIQCVSVTDRLEITSLSVHSVLLAGFSPTSPALSQLGVGVSRSCTDLEMSSVTHWPPSLEETATQSYQCLQQH